MNEPYLWIAVSIMALVTALTRFLPFMIFRNEQNVPKLVKKLGKVLPYAIMGMLVVYCLKDIQITDTSSILPAALACAAVTILYLLKRNTLLSILGGTLCYMLLVQVVF